MLFAALVPANGGRLRFRNDDGAIARDAGIAHVYLGNVRTRDGATTRCAGCGDLLVDRVGYRVADYRITPEGACPQCGREVAGIWDPAGPSPAVG